MFRSGMWDGKIYFVDKFGRFPIGLLGKFLEFCDRFKYDCSFDFPEKDFGEKISDEVLSIILTFFFHQRRIFTHEIISKKLLQKK